MPLTAQQLEAALAGPDPKDFASFEFEKEIGKYVGHVVRRDFARLSVPERQKSTWDMLRSEFGAASQEVSLVLTYSPAEWAEVGAEALAG